jgi:hypothetical protein
LLDDGRIWIREVQKLTDPTQHYSHVEERNFEKTFTGSKTGSFKKLQEYENVGNLNSNTITT